MLNGISLARQVTERKKRLSTKSPTVRNMIVTTENAQLAISQFSKSAVTKENADYCFKILEKVEEKSPSNARTLANYIANDIVLGLESFDNIFLSDYNISENCKSIIEYAMDSAQTCDRVLINQSRLEGRYNFDKIAKSNYSDPDKIIRELCELIDTYTVAPYVKYNIALENILYTLRKNHVKVESDLYVAEQVTDYFMTRELCIPDHTYKKYKTILENSMVYNTKNAQSSSVVHAVLGTSASYWTDSVSKVLNSMKDTYVGSKLWQEFTSINTEFDVANYIENAAAYADALDMSADDKAKICYSVQTIPKCKDISPDFVEIKKSEYFINPDFNDVLASDAITNALKPIVEPEPENLGEYLEKQYTKAKSISFNEAEDQHDKAVKDVVAKFKAEQDKSPSKIKQFLQKLYAKDPEDIIYESLSIMSVVRAGILLCIATLTPIGPIIAGVVGLVSWLINKKINEEQAKKFLSTIRSEKKKIKEKIEKTDNDKKKKELQEYLKGLDSCDEKLQNYLSNFNDDDNSEDDDDGGFGDMDDAFGDLDFGDESALEKTALFVAECSKVLDDDTLQKVDLNKIVPVLAENKMLSEASPFIKLSSFNIEEYATVLGSIKENYKDTLTRSIIVSEQYSLDLRKPDYGTIRNVLAEEVANRTLEDIQYSIIDEKVNLNTLKLAIQNGKAKLKNLGTKEKALWQSVDAHASELSKGIEKALTSDRREAVIKGTIVPSLSKCIKGAIALSGIGLIFGPAAAAISAVGALGVSKALNHRERKFLLDEIDTELTVIEKEIEMAQNDGNMKKYRYLLNYQKKLTREYQRIRYGLKVSGRDIPNAVIPGKVGDGRR